MTNYLIGIFVTFFLFMGLCGREWWKTIKIMDNQVDYWKNRANTAEQKLLKIERESKKFENVTLT